MINIRELHDRAMEIAHLAIEAKNKGFSSIYLILSKEAFYLEKEAALLLKDDYDIEPTRSVFLRSAATMGIDCGFVEEADTLIKIALRGKPYPEIKKELYDLKKEIKQLKFNPIQENQETIISETLQLLNNFKNNEINIYILNKCIESLISLFPYDQFQVVNADQNLNFEKFLKILKSISLTEDKLSSIAIYSLLKYQNMELVKDEQIINHIMSDRQIYSNLMQYVFDNSTETIKNYFSDLIYVLCKRNVRFLIDVLSKDCNAILDQELYLKSYIKIEHRNRNILICPTSSTYANYFTKDFQDGINEKLEDIENNCAECCS